MGARVDVELANGERLSLRFPGERVVGGGTWDCERLTAQLTDRGRRLLRTRVFAGPEDLLMCLFGGTPAGEQDLDEVDVDLAGVADPGATLPEGAEYLGAYDSVPAYLRAMLEPEVSRACAWILDLLDWPAVRRRWESDGSRLVCERGRVFRLAAPDDGDPAGPWMPTRGE
jgi:hypothetical protein